MHDSTILLAMGYMYMYRLYFKIIQILSSTVESAGTGAYMNFLN